MKALKAVGLVALLGVGSALALGGYRLSQGCCPMTGEPMDGECKSPCENEVTGNCLTEPSLAEGTGSKVELIPASLAKKESMAGNEKADEVGSGGASPSGN